MTEQEAINELNGDAVINVGLRDFGLIICLAILGGMVSTLPTSCGAHAQDSGVGEPPALSKATASEENAGEAAKYTPNIVGVSGSTHQRTPAMAEEMRAVVHRETQMEARQKRDGNGAVILAGSTLVSGDVPVNIEGVTGGERPAILPTALMPSAPAHGFAQAAGGGAVDRSLAATLAIVALHEGAIENPWETALVWQCAETNAHTPAGRLAWLRAHSPRATGYAAPFADDTNAWTARFNFRDVPSGFADGDYFRAVTMPRARQVLAYARGLVSGNETLRPCRVAPKSWATRASERVAAERSGLYPIGCVGTRNDGYATRAQIASAQ